MCSIPIFYCILTMVLNFAIYVIFSMFIFNSFYNYSRFSCFYMIFAGHLLVILFLFFLILIIFVVCSCQNSKNHFMQSLPLYTLCLFSILLHDDILGIEKPNIICSPTFDVDEFPGFLLYPSNFSIRHSRSA